MPFPKGALTSLWHLDNLRSVRLFKAIAAVSLNWAIRLENNSQLL
jgi:hypothetical protein